ncbi:hypothetical protein [Gracilibacillus phocaeensis]|nr:hypothetical protein [Gracilibacillus phocaeensis]
MTCRKQKKKLERQAKKVATTNHLTSLVSVVANGLKAVYYFIKTFFQ